MKSVILSLCLFGLAAIPETAQAQFTPTTNYGVIKIKNKTKYTVNYYIRWGNGTWSKQFQMPGTESAYRSPTATASMFYNGPALQIKFQTRGTGDPMYTQPITLRVNTLRAGGSLMQYGLPYAFRNRHEF